MLLIDARWIVVVIALIGTLWLCRTRPQWAVPLTVAIAAATLAALILFQIGGSGVAFDVARP